MSRTLATAVRFQLPYACTESLQFHASTCASTVVQVLAAKGRSVHPSAASIGIKELLDGQMRNFVRFRPVFLPHDEDSISAAAEMGDRNYVRDTAPRTQ